MTTKSKVLEQLKACGDSLTACGDQAGGALIHSLHAHMIHSASLQGSAANTSNEEIAIARINKTLDGKSPLQSLLEKLDLSASASKKYSIQEIDRKLEAAGIKGTQAIAAKMNLQRAGLL